MSLATEIIRQRLASEVSPNDLDLVTGLVADRLDAGATMASIGAAITAAKTEYAVLFRPADTKTTAAETNLPVGFRAPPDRAGERLRVATADGNPWMSASVNVTRQIMLEHADPELAARMRAEAGSSR